MEEIDAISIMLLAISFRDKIASVQFTPLTLRPSDPNSTTVLFKISCSCDLKDLNPHLDIHKAALS